MTKGKRSTSWIGIVLMAGIVVGQGAASAVAKESAALEGVKVTVKYTGKGAVDGSHRLWIWLFDSPDIGPGAMPLAEMSLDTNGATAAFDHVTAQEVWIAVAYDEKGGFGGQAPPPSGSPVTLYGIESGPPASVTPGSDASVTVTFDDAQRMP